MSSLGLIIGRFQPFHKGHKLLVESSLKENPASLILIGSSNKEDSQNPYDYEFRKSIISHECGEGRFSIGPLPDFPNDNDWKDMILSYIPEKVSTVTLYCGDIKNDSAAISLLSLESTLPFSLIIKEIPRSIIPVSASKVRKWISLGDTENLKKYLGQKTLLFLGIKL